MSKKTIARAIEETSFLEISLVYGGERVNFNLAEELKVSEARINQELKEQPSYYGFLMVLSNRLERHKDDAKMEVEKTSSRLFIQYKDQLDPNTQRPLNNDLAEAKVKTNKRYIRAVKKYNKIKEDWGIIKSCTEAFYQRSSLIQTLSANQRQERVTNN